MSVFTIDVNTQLTEEFLASIKDKSWEQINTWSRATELQVSDPVDRERIMGFWKKSYPSFDEKTLIRQWVMHRATMKQQVPSHMAIDTAMAKGEQITYSATKVVAGERVVPASRVPIAEDTFAVNAKGDRVMRRGSDVLAASLGAMTRWNKNAVVWSMPLDSMAKHDFEYADVKGVELLVTELPKGPQDCGLKGRAWAFHLMTHFQQMPVLEYYELASNWARAMFGLPYPTEGQKIDPVFKDNITLITISGKYYWAIDYKTPSALATYNMAFSLPEQYAEMGAQVISFAADRQGDNAGVSMLSQSAASWGLVSKGQAELEQTVSVILGMNQELWVISGYSVTEHMRIATSVKFWNDKVVVKMLEPAHLVKDPKNQVSKIPSGAVHLIKGSTVIDTGVAATKNGKVKTYQGDLIQKKMWDHVEAACADKEAVYLAAGLPPKNLMQINIFLAGAAWAGVFFFSQRNDVARARIGDKGLVRDPPKKISTEEAWAAIVKGMNNSIASWIVPPVNRNFCYSELLRPITSDKKMSVTFRMDSDEFAVQYEETDDIEEEDEDGAGSEADVELPVPKKKKKGDEQPALPKRGYVPVIEEVDPADI